MKKTLRQAQQSLGTSRPTLNKYIRLLDIKLQSDRFDKRMKLISDEDIERIRELINRTKVQS